MLGEIDEINDLIEAEEFGDETVEKLTRAIEVRIGFMGFRGGFINIYQLLRIII